MTGLIAALLAGGLMLFWLGLHRLFRRELPAQAQHLGYAPVASARTGKGLRLSSLKPTDMLRAALGGTAGYLAALAVFGDGVLALAGATVGLVLLPGAWQRWQAERRRQQLIAQVERALAHLAASLRGSASIQQALQQVAEETPAPLGEELQFCVALMRSGYTLELALDRLRERIRAAEFDLMAVSTEIAAEMGANLATTYDRVAETLRERRNFRGAVGAVTAQGRYGAMVVTMMPFLVLGFLRFANPDYLAPLLETAGGRMLILICCGLILAGWGLIRRIVDVRLD